MHAIEHPLRRGRADAGQKLHQPEAGDPVARVLHKPQQGEHVLDVRGIEELEAAELHEGNVAAGQLHLERPAMMRGPEQHRLLLEADAGLAVRQHLLDDVAGLVGLVAHGDQLRPLGRGAVGPEVLGEALGGELDHRIGRGQDRLGRAVVAVERDDRRPAG